MTTVIVFVCAGMGLLAGLQCDKTIKELSHNGRPVAVLNTPSSVTPVITTTPAPAPHKNYVVKRGDFLRKIAQEHGVAWEAILMLNETFLQTKYEEVCNRMSPRYRNRHGGLFCNDRYNRPYGNTLVPGWEIKIPTTQAPSQIERAIQNIVGNKIAVVIDDTGSVENDRILMSEWYMAAIKTSRKQIVGVWLYADGRVRHYAETGEVVFLTTGGVENTFGALQEAAAEKPDSIVLVTDEPGDDWNWSEVKNLPPVTAHCLAEQGAYWCQTNLRKLAQETKGQYMDGLQ